MGPSRKRIAGLAALAFGGATLLGACDGSGQSLCDTLFDAREDLASQISSLEEQQSSLDPTSVEYDLLEVAIAGAEELLEAKEAAMEAANCLVD